ncbi:MAG: hypothetical protein M1836_003280 [Candelina mexicana]|nr:MAG: hypothetical protein M1836_003280 [Candelina mexicana]
MSGFGRRYKKSVPISASARQSAWQRSSELHAESFNSMLKKNHDDPEAQRRRAAASKNTLTASGICVIQEQYRAAGPYLSLTPAITFALDEDDELLKKIRNCEVSLLEEVNNILNQEGVRLESPVTGPFRKRSTLETDEDRPDAIILDEDVWFAAISRILTLFREWGLDGLNIEFVDKREEGDYYMSPIEKGEKIIEDWEHARPMVHALLHDSVMPIPYQLIDFMRCGPLDPDVDHNVNPVELRLQIFDTSIAWNACYIKSLLEVRLRELGLSEMVVAVDRGRFWM